MNLAVARPGLPALRFRPMTRADLAAVMAIENVSFPTPWTEAMVLAELQAPHSRLRLAEADHRVLGYLIAWLTSTEASIMSLAVHPDWRRRGLGSALLDDILTLLRADELATVWLEVRTGNLAAQALYARYRFVEIYRRRGYYQDTGEDAIVMMREVVLR